MRHLLETRHWPVWLALVAGLGFGCGSTGGSGCGGLAPLPSDPQPTGFPFDQRIEGGMQARITPSGFTKLTSLIPDIIAPTLQNPICLPHQNNNFTIGQVDACYQGCGGGQGCPTTINLNSQVAPPSGIQISMPDGNNPVLDVKVGFDIHSDDILIRAKAFIGGWFDICGSGDPLMVDSVGNVLDANIGFGIDPPTGQLTVQLQSINQIMVHFTSSGCGVAGDILNFLLSAFDAFINSFIGQYIANFLAPQLNSLIAGFVPNPPGMAGVLSTAQLLASMSPPDNAALEMYLVAGGYVSGYQGGLNLGVITGMNSDNDPTTRTAGLTSEPNLCVPSRPAPILGGPPWNLPDDPTRQDPKLDPAPEFSGMPDPVDSSGNPQDIALGLSRSFLDIAGFHLYNSGTMCLAVSGDKLSVLNAGALSVLVPSLSNIIEDKKGPLALAIRPEHPLSFTLGAGDMNDPLIHIHVEDLRIDFYAFIEERFVRVFTLSANMEVKLQLIVGADMNGNPTIQPMVTGIDKSSIKLAVLNTDLLQEDPNKLALTLSSLIDVAVGQLMGAIKPFALPSLMGFQITDLSITRVQSTQDDFIAIYGSLLAGAGGGQGGMPMPKLPHMPPLHSIDTRAEVLHVDTPAPSVLRDSAMAQKHQPGEVPSVTLRLGGNGSRVMEWSLRVDGGGWRPWSGDANPVVTDPAFMLQAHHTIDVRARERGDWLSEDQTPVRLDVTIDSAPPELQPAVHGGNLHFGGWDNVSADDKILYSWNTPAGWTKPAPISALTLDEAWAATSNGQRPFELAAVDELGNRGVKLIDLNGLNEFHGRTTSATSSGCGCAVGAQPSSGEGALVVLGALPLLGLMLRRRRRPFVEAPATDSSSPKAGPKPGMGGFYVLVAIASLSSLVAGCNCTNSVSSGCVVDDDCRSMKCDTGLIPQCSQGACMCNPGTPLGDVGRFSSLALIHASAYVAAYNNTYGDLMIGHNTPPGRITNWEFVDGVPETAASDYQQSQVRGGITEPGDDVGRYASIQATPQGDPVVAYYDLTHGALKFASFGVVRWHSHVVDKGMGTPKTGGDNIGRWASLSLAKDGTPGIAYYAEIQKGASGGPEGQLRWAQAMTPTPKSSADWNITIIETRPLPDVMMGQTPDYLPDGIALFNATARKSDDSPVIAYYDRLRGNLRFVSYDPSNGWGTPVILDGEDASGNDTGDVGQYPSVALDEGDVAHISYVDATRDNLLYVNTKDMTPEVADDGYRDKDETTDDNLPAPVYHLVGDSSSIQVSQGEILIAYQDSTVLQLRLAGRDAMTGQWATVVIAGHAMNPFKGSYGFYAQNRVSGGVAILSSYAIDQQMDVPDFWVETFAVNIGSVM